MLGMIWKPWLRGLFLTIDGAAPDAGGGTPEPAAPPVPDVSDVAALDEGDAGVKSDYDILSEEDTPAPDADKEPPKEGEEDEPAPVAAKTPEQIEQEKGAAKTPEQIEADKQAAAAEAPVKALKEAIERDPGLKAALDKNPTFRNKIFIDARRSAKLALYTPHFATPEIAQQAVTDLSFFNDFEQDYTSAKPEASMSLLTRLLEADKVRDAGGNPVRDEATGLDKVNGNYARLLTTYRMQGLYPALELNAKRLADYSPEEQKEFLDGEEFDPDTFRVAMNLIKRMMGDPIEEARPQVTTAGRAGANGKAGAFDESKLPEETRKLIERGRAASEAEGKGANDAAEAQQTKVTEGIKTSCQAALSERIKVVGKAFTPAIQAKIIEDSWKELNVMARQDLPYRRSMQAISNKYSGKEQIDRCAAFATAYVKERMNEVIKKVTATYTDGAVAANADKHAKLAEGADKNREPRTQGGVSSPSRRDEGQLVQECTKLFRQLHGRGPKDLEILGFDEEELGNLQRQAKALGR